MQSSKYLLSALTLATAMSFGPVVMAADMAKEIGLNMTDGFLDHMTWHCWGSGDYVKGMGVDQRHCTATDLSGDKLVAKFVSEKHTADQKNFTVTVTCDGGTGKYTGASCTETDTMRGNEFPAAPEGSYVQYVTFQGTYKLP